MKTTVRFASENDIDTLVKLISRLKDLNSELDPHYSTMGDLENIVRKYISESLNNPENIMLVAEDEDSNKITGVIRAQYIDRLFYVPRKALLITDIYVDPRYRRKGLGTLLLQKLEETAREKGIELIIASYPAGNIIADQFFTRKNFKPLQIEKYKHLR